MNITFIFVVASFVALSAKRPRETQRQSLSDDSGLSSEELPQDMRPPFEIKGTIRRSFALEAAKVVPNRDMICSPISALLPLGKLILGTVRGQSRQELLKAIGTTQRTVKKRLKSMLNELKYLPGITLTLASRLFVNKAFDISKKYLNTIKETFSSTLEKMNFAKPKEAAKNINRWVSLNTAGYIPNIISPEDISNDTSILLVNAVYFKGFWKYPFKHNYVGDFQSPQGNRRVTMMTRTMYCNYIESHALSAKIIEIHYDRENSSFVIVLPMARNGLQILLSAIKLAPELLNKEISRMSESFIKVDIPKFRIETELNLKDLYQKIGVNAIFTENSGLDGITTGKRVYVTKAVQKACIEVTDKGSIASASTAVNTMLISHKIPKAEFIADHPFLFFVKAAHQQLFAGVFNSV